MAIYDVNGNEISDGGGSGGGSIVMDAGVIKVPFEDWTQGKLNTTTGAASSSTTNYCLPLSYGLALTAGMWLAIPSGISGSMDFSYERFEGGVAVGDLKTDGISTSTFVRGAVSIFEIPYDGVYCFNIYYGADSASLEKTIDALTIYTADYAEGHRGLLFGGQDSHGDYVRTIVHKGICVPTGSNTGYGNTMPMFKQALKRGFVIIETDLRVTSDNVPVLCHDETFGGLTIASSTLSELQAVTVGVGMWNATIPTFDEFLYWCKCNNVSVYLDCKVTTNAACDLYFTIVKKYGMMDKVTWFGNPAYIITLDEKARVGTFSASAPSDWLTGKNEVVVNPPVTSMSQTASNAIIDAGMIPECYTTVNGTAQLITASALGIRGVTTEIYHAQHTIAD